MTIVWRKLMQLWRPFAVRVLWQRPPNRLNCQVRALFVARWISRRTQFREERSWSLSDDVMMDDAEVVVVGTNCLVALSDATAVAVAAAVHFAFD